MNQLLKTLDMRNIILILGTVFIGLLNASCSKSGGELLPTNEWYFAYEVDGVAHRYFYRESENNLRSHLATPSSGISGFLIFAMRSKFDVPRSEFRFVLDELDWYGPDVFYFNKRNNKVDIYELGSAHAHYSTVGPSAGKLILTERTDSTIKGQFEFEANKVRYESGIKIVTDTIIHITNGEFYMGINH